MALDSSSVDICSPHNHIFSKSRIGEKLGNKYPYSNLKWVHPLHFVTAAKAGVPLFLG